MELSPMSDSVYTLLHIHNITHTYVEREREEGEEEGELRESNSKL